MTLNDVVAVVFVISTKTVAFGAHCVKVVDDIPKLSATEMLSKASSFYRYIIYDDFYDVRNPSTEGH